MKVTCSDDKVCPIIVNSKCVFYEGIALPYTGIITNDTIQTSLQKIEAIIAGVSTAAVWGNITGTIANQTDLTAYILSLSGSGVVTSITAGIGISIGGTAAVPIITNTSPSSLITASNGLTKTGNDIQLGGTLVSSVTIETGPSSHSFIANKIDDLFDGPASFGLNSGAYIQSAAVGSVLYNTLRAANGQILVTDNRVTKIGIEYAASGYETTDLSLTSKGYVLGAKTFTGSQTFRTGTATAGTAPAYLVSGVALTTPADGALEYHASHLYFTIGATRYQLDQQGGGGITNTALVNQVAISDGTNIVGDTAFTWDATNDALTINGVRLHVRGSSSIYLGANSGSFTTTSSNNLGLGHFSLNAITTGFGNTALGTTAMKTLTTGECNVWVGQDNSVGFNGNRNIVIGTHTVVASVLTTGSYNVLIGNEIRSATPAADGQLSIQNIIFGLGNTATAATVSTGFIGIGEPAPTRKLEVAGSLAVKSGTSTGQAARVGGVIKTDTTTTGNVGIGDDTLQTYSIPPNTLATDKDTIVGTCSGTFAATINNKRVRVKFGATTIFDSGALAITAATDWALEFEIIRTGATTQKCNTRFNTSSATLSAYCDYSTAAETLSGTVILLITGEATADNDVVKETFKLRWEPSE